MRLFHFSDNPNITTFVPRPVLVPAMRAEGMEWLNGPLVWATEERLEFMYLFPRQCPRILVWPKEDSSDSDIRAWLGSARAAAFVEQDWLDELAATTIYRYELPTERFEDLNDAGMWVSRSEVQPLRCEAIDNLPAEIRKRGVDLRFVVSLLPFKPLWETTLHASGIRLRNATDWQ